MKKLYLYCLNGIKTNQANLASQNDFFIIRAKNFRTRNFFPDSNASLLYGFLGLCHQGHHGPQGNHGHQGNLVHQGHMGNQSRHGHQGQSLSICIQFTERKTIYIGGNAQNIKKLLACRVRASSH